LSADLKAKIEDPAESFDEGKGCMSSEEMGHKGM
jgi:hypothetical protein